eukprot:COSAG02_NODE_11392_length_1732_cov_385.942108_2_plen_239_part_01
MMMLAAALSAARMGVVGASAVSEEDLHAARYVEVGWKYFLSAPGYSGEHVSAGECTRSWERTDGAIWELAGVTLRLVNTSLCVDSSNISSAMDDSAEVHLAPCDSAVASQRWAKRPGGSLQSLEPGPGRCLAPAPGNATILATLQMVACNDADAQQKTLWQPNGQILVGPRELCVQAASAVPHRRRRLQMDAQNRSLLRHQADAFFARLAPLYRNTSGPIGLVVSAGWILDLVTEWTGI